MVNLFVRQPFTESGPQEKQIVQSVLDLVQELAAMRSDVTILTDTQAQAAESFVSRFEELTGIAFSPVAFRNYRLALLKKADAIIHIRTSLSESSAFEIAYNIFKGRRAPMFFCVWDKAPLKTTLLRDLDDLCPSEYVVFSEAEDLRAALVRFLAQF